MLLPHVSLSIHIPCSCLLRCHLFYCTGDLQGVDVHRSMYMEPITSHRKTHIDSFSALFDIPPFTVPSVFTPKPTYYDVECREHVLHLTVENEYDSEGREILVVAVRRAKGGDDVGSGKAGTTPQYRSRAHPRVHWRRASSRNEPHEAFERNQKHTPTLYLANVLQKRLLLFSWRYPQ